MADVTPPLLTAKLALPPAPEYAVPRPRLDQALDAGAAGPVTLVSAPAGWGKTTLLGAWAAGRGAAWLALEPGDDDERFWCYLYAALRTRGVPAPAGEAAELFLPLFANALARLDEPVVLVLDDFHHVHAPAVLAGLEFLLRHAAGRLHLVLSGRADPPLPLHRWRLSGELTEVRAGDLAFTPAETADLLERHGTVLPDADRDALHEHAEGWPAGLRLAVLAMRADPNPAGFVGQFGGDHPAVADYLAGEVRADLPADRWDLLMRTSVLERICAGLLDALTGRHDGERVLADLARANSFLVPVGGGRHWYRHHRLFGELLRAELRDRYPEQVPDLHRRAAAWHAAHGLAVDALRHALAAHDWPYATRLLVEHWHDLVLCGHDVTLRSLVPSPPREAVRADPVLALAYAADRLELGDADGADGYLQLAERNSYRLDQPRRDRFGLMRAAFGLAEAQVAGDLAKVLSAAPRLLDLAGDDDATRAVALTTLGAARLNLGDLDAAEDTLANGLAAARLAGLACPQVRCASKLALIRAVRGELRSAESVARLALGLPPCPGREHLAHIGHAYLALAVVDYQRDRLDDAAGYLALADRSCDRRLEPVLAAGIAMVRSWLARARGEPMRGYDALRVARRELGGQPVPAFLTDSLTSAEAELRTERGDTDTARALLTPGVPGAHPLSPVLAVALARTYLRDDQPAQAARLVPAWTDDRHATLALRLESGLLDALAARRQGDDRRASRNLERVLQLAEPDGFRRVFTRGGPETLAMLCDHLDSGTAYWSLVTELIDASDAPPVSDEPPPAALSIPLTDREVTILRYLQGSLSNHEIAVALRLSVNTVKTHVRHIYRKLDTDRRREAIRRARELDLI